MATTHSFSGRRVLITGGARGIGYEITKRFYNAGATVFVIGKNPDNLKKVKEDFPNVRTFAVDVANWKAVQDVVFSITPLDHLVNNAGVLQAQFLVDLTPENFDTSFGVNVRGYVAVAQAFVNGNRAQGHPGTIVNVGSLADRVALWGCGIYCATKAAISRLTALMAMEFGEYNIRVNCVNPCFVMTDMVTSIPQDYMALAAPTLARIPNKTPIESSDVAESVLFLSSDASRMVNGTTLVIDGGCRAAS